MILIKSIQEELYKIVNVCFNTLLLHLMLPVMGRKMTVMMVKGKPKLLLAHKTPQISGELEDSQSSAGNSSQSQSQSSCNRVTTPSPLTLCRRPTPGKRMHYSPRKDAIEDKLHQIIENQKRSLMKMKCFVLV